MSPESTDVIEYADYSEDTDLQYSLLHPDEITAIVSGTYRDVFSLLGMHKVDKDTWRFTVFLPGALGVSAISGSGETVLAELECLHPDGLFCGIATRKRAPSGYRLRVQYPLSTIIRDDPYRFGSLLNAHDAYLFSEGSLEQGWKLFGANPAEVEGVSGVQFAVWAPNARRVSVVGDFNHWDGRVHIMRLHPGSGIWDMFIPDVAPGFSYKYEIIGPHGEMLPLKADPYGRAMELRPSTASVIPPSAEYAWHDEEWMEARAGRIHHAEPLRIYEVHAGSWKRRVEEDSRYLTYRELADELVPYVKEMGFSHIQFMPLTEFPFDGSWGYQPLGMFAATCRFGTADDLRYLIDTAHQQGIGVLMDWVPGHFPTDSHGLGWFDGSHLYEHADPRKGFHPDWNTLIYNYGRSEVCSYLVSNVFYWLQEFHVDGLRFDAVASMLYLDYSREHDQWIPNCYGGRENLEAISLLRDINTRAYANFPGVLMIAEESTAWPGVTRFVEHGGLGFGFKWNLGWMNDTLSYLGRDPVYRKYHHGEFTFSFLYGFSENFILPLSHDEVVHGKGSILHRIPGDDWQKFATLRAYYGFMYGHPGKKLLFMGDEIAQRDEWNYNTSIDWHLLQWDPHQGVLDLVKDLNTIYASSPSLFEMDCENEGFEWVDGDNRSESIFAFLRKDREGREVTLVATNMTPTPLTRVTLGVPYSGYYREILNTNADRYGGTGEGNLGGVQSSTEGSHGRPFSVRVVLPPLATVMLRWEAVDAE